uniref:Ig-like domain-containing protein n=1 Tax=Salarias fasciatus TaxID=181472 RepID=A0A672GZU0_SALFA
LWRSPVSRQPPTPSLTLLTPWPDVFENEVVEFSCEVSDLDWTYSWYKNQQALQEDDVLSLDEDEGSFRIDAVSLSDSGTYECRAERNKTGFKTEHSNKRKLVISGEPIKVWLFLSVTRWLDVFRSESVTLGCGMELNSSVWTYEWYKDAEKVNDDKTVSFGSDRATLSIAVDSVSQSGNYSCSGKLKSGSARRSVSSKASPPLALQVYGELLRLPDFTVKPDNYELPAKSNMSSPEDLPSCSSSVQ